MSAQLLQIQAARLRLGPRELGPFSFALRAGERVAILGPSGAGKSSLLRLMARELGPVDGQLQLDGQSLAGWTPAALARRRAVLPQQHGVAFGLPVPLVVALGRVARRADAQQERIVAEALACAQASHLADRQFDTLSGGEQARVQLARVFAQLWDEREGLLLVDEPLAALDPGLALELMLAISGFAAARGHALVAVLHDLNMALNHFERLWLLKDGRVLADCEVRPEAPQIVLPLLEQLYELRLRLLRDAEGVAVLASGAASARMAA